MISYFDLLAPLYDFIIKPKEPEKLLATIDFQAVDKFIEIGGGTGRFTQYFAPKVGKTWILDPSMHMLRKAEQKHPNFRLVNGAAQKIPFPDNFFGLILIYDSLHHWDDHSTAIKEVYRTLGYNKDLVIGEIHPGTRSGYFISMMENMLGMNSKFYSPRELIAFVERHGLVVREKGWLNRPTYYIIATKATMS